MGETLLRRIAARGYAWYLAMKIIKAISAPAVIAAQIPLLLLFTILLTLKAAAEEFWKCIVTIPEFMREFCGGQWLSGFSRAHYISLYRKPKPIIYRMTEPPK